MEVSFLRGATIILSDGNRRLICDPWLEDGIYYGAWAHYPPFTEEDWRHHSPTDVDYIYISHVHPDHFDPQTLKRFSGQKVIIHKYVGPFLKRKIEALGFEVVELENGAVFEMGNQFNIRVFAADDCDPTKCGVFFRCAPGVRSAQLDSLAVITTPTCTIANVNDCPWGLGDKLAAKLGNEYDFDLACIAYALAGATPHCFKMRQVDVARQARARCGAGLMLLRNWANALKVKNVLPFAGDYQLCSWLSEVNENRGIPEIESVREWLSTVGLNPSGNELSSDYRLDYVAEILSLRKLDYESEPLPKQQDVIDLLKPAFEHFDAKRKEYDFKAKATIYFRLGKDYWYVVPPTGGPHYSAEIDRTGPFISVECDVRLFKKLLMGPKHAHWNNAEIGSHLTFERRGDMEFGLQLLMSYFHG